MRRRVVAAVEGGLSQAGAAEQFGVSRRSVGIWVRAHRVAGPEALRSRTRGRRPGEQLALNPDRQTEVLSTMIAGPPEQAGLAHSLWNRRALVELIESQCDVRVTLATAGQFLLRWGVLSHRTAVSGTTPVTLFRSGGRRGSREVFFASWSLLALPLVESSSADPVQALVAQNVMGGASFLLSRTAFDLEALVDFGERVATMARGPSHLVVFRWPREHESVLQAWIADPGTLIRLTLA